MLYVMVIIPLFSRHKITNTGKTVLRFISVDSPIYSPKDTFEVK